MTAMYRPSPATWLGASYRNGRVVTNNDDAETRAYSSPSPIFSSNGT